MANLTYCTNVHPLDTFTQWKDTISFFGPKIREMLKKDNLALGLWFNANLVREICAKKSQKLSEIKDLMEVNSLSVHTLNCFPFGNFHQDVVKKAVYLPNWIAPERARYTLDCAEILSDLMTEEKGTLSTLPLAWKGDWSDSDLEPFTKNIFEVITGLKKIYEKKGKVIQVCFEPEPGCVLEHSREAVDFWERHLRPSAANWDVTPEELGRHCGLCYDTCHQAVQFEDPVESLKTFIQWGIPVGKIQISNAPEFLPDENRATLRDREKFCEARFLHQTRVYQEGAAAIYFEDLHLAIQNDEYWNNRWRSHFHLPVFADAELLGPVHTTQKDMLRAVEFSLKENMCDHYEVETYTWGVLPSELRPTDRLSLAAGIARELQFIQPLFGEKRQ